MSGKKSRSPGEPGNRRDSIFNKDLVVKLAHSHRYQVTGTGLRTITALVVLHDKVLKPLLAALSKPSETAQLRARQGRKPKAWSRLDDLYQNLRLTLHALLGELHIAQASTIFCG